MTKRKHILLYGKLNVKAFGAYPESFVSAAIAGKINIYDVIKIDSNTLSFEIAEADLAFIEKLSEKYGMELELKHRDQAVSIAKHRRPLFVLAFLAFTLLSASSLFVWQIDIYGNQSMSRGEVLRALEDSGLYYGRFWPSIKADDIRSGFMAKLPDVAWMTVNTSGSRAVVLINERIEKPEIYDETAGANLVASRMGIIRRVSLLQGRAVVSPGQAVTEGELLASGDMQALHGEHKTLRSKGNVIADTWYEITSVCPEKLDIKGGVKRQRQRFAVVLGKRRINFYFSSGKAIDGCDKIIKEYRLGFDGQLALPLRLVHEQIICREISSGDAYDKDEMHRRLSRILDDVKGQVLQSAFTECNADGLYMLTLRAHCVENIALTQEIT